MGEPRHHGGEEALREKRLVALSSVLAAVLLTGMKVAVGLATGSLGILSEAAHSALDLVAAAVTLWAVRASARPADLDHPYGHGKVENLSALFETALLLATCLWIVWESVERLFFRPVAVEATAWAFAVMVVSIVVDVSRSRALRRAARKYASRALEADALHFSTDVWSSSVVIGGLALVRLADRLGQAWLAQADAVAALAVAGIVVGVSVRVGKKSIDDLLDAVPPGVHQAVVRAARVPGVLDVRQARIRRSGAETFADVTVTVGRDASFERAHEVASAVEDAIRAAVPGTDAVVHVEPVHGAAEGALAAVRLCAARHGLGAHAIRLHGPDRRALDVHLEVPDGLRVGEAAALVHRFEEDVRRELPALARVDVHIEPVGDGTAPPPVPEDGAAIAALAAALAAEQGEGRVADVRVARAEEGLTVALRWHLPAELPVVEARRRGLELERALRERVPGIARVLVRLDAPAEEPPRSA
ncbi:MAG TPA: cation diffusion facilitator family transporter [Anaeromyxobacteraceae bacterium]|nr:cation diffusion facilitator family transporter [Anaeromyxobacteraceae bacterium]